MSFGHFETGQQRTPMSRRESKADRLIEYRGLVADLEHSALYGKTQRPEELEAQAQKIRDRYPELEHHELDYYVAAAWHDLSNAYRNGFLASLEGTARSAKLSISRLGPDDVSSYYMDFPDKKKLETMEDRALKAYQAAQSGPWSTPRYADQTDAAVLALDLKDRIATRRLEGEERDKKQMEIRAEMQRIIEGMDDSGKRHELQLICLLRTWIQEKGLSHVMAVEHGLPREDVGDLKTDIRLILGDLLIPLQIKVEALADAYRAEHFTAVHEKALAATKGTGTLFVAIDVNTLRDEYKLATTKLDTKGEKQKKTRLKHALLETIMRALPEEGIAALRLLMDKLEEGSKKEVSLINADFLARNSGVPLLKTLGLLDTDLSAATITAAKKVLLNNIQIIRDIFGTREAFQKPSVAQVAELKQALKGHV